MKSSRRSWSREYSSLAPLSRAKATTCSSFELHDPWPSASPPPDPPRRPQRSGRGPATGLAAARDLNRSLLDSSLRSRPPTARRPLPESIQRRNSRAPGGASPVADIGQIPPRSLETRTAGLADLELERLAAGFCRGAEPASRRRGPRPDRSSQALCAVRFTFAGSDTRRPPGTWERLRLRGRASTVTDRRCAAAWSGRVRLRMADRGRGKQNPLQRGLAEPRGSSADGASGPRRLVQRGLGALPPSRISANGFSEK